MGKGEGGEEDGLIVIQFLVMLTDLSLRSLTNYLR